MRVFMDLLDLAVAGVLTRERSTSPPAIAAYHRGPTRSDALARKWGFFPDCSRPR